MEAGTGPELVPGSETRESEETKNEKSNFSTDFWSVTIRLGICGFPAQDSRHDGTVFVYRYSL